MHKIFLCWLHAGVYEDDDMVHGVPTFYNPHACKDFVIEISIYGMYEVPKAFMAMSMWDKPLYYQGTLN